jgi:hypothetical protein
VIEAPLVVVTRNGYGWLAEIPAPRTMPGARSLISLGRAVRELVGPGWVDVEFHTGNVDLDQQIGEVRTARRTARVAEADPPARSSGTAVTRAEAVGGLLPLPAAGTAR